MAEAGINASSDIRETEQQGTTNARRQAVLVNAFFYAARGLLEGTDSQYIGTPGILENNRSVGINPLTGEPFIYGAAGNSTSQADKPSVVARSWMPLLLVAGAVYLMSKA